jgi:hypothetical protein
MTCSDEAPQRVLGASMGTAVHCHPRSGHFKVGQQAAIRWAQQFALGKRTSLPDYAEERPHAQDGDLAGRQS